jgi:hypothetical protein
MYLLELFVIRCLTSPSPIYHGFIDSLIIPTFTPAHAVLHTLQPPLQPSFKNLFALAFQLNDICVEQLMSHVIGCSLTALLHMLDHAFNTICAYWHTTAFIQLAVYMSVTLPM